MFVWMKKTFGVKNHSWLFGEKMDYKNDLQGNKKGLHFSAHPKKEICMQSISCITTN